mmetsp:Transcript_26729/g.44340  ORF Transcript_26729/g.44340 Transcript_26729/m.44340 type:complete len:86 (+) Transcript_26729:278-535(+)
MPPGGNILLGCEMRLYREAPKERSIITYTLDVALKLRNRRDHCWRWTMPSALEQFSRLNSLLVAAHCIVGSSPEAFNWDGALGFF